MSTVPHVHTGACHCGAVRVRFTASQPAPDLQVRACQCGFCTRHGAMTVSDPAGRVVIEATGRLGRYQFATRTAESLLCPTCGMYIGALLTYGGRQYAVVNVRGLAMEAFAGRTAEAVSYDAESATGRIARRASKWTPAEVRERV